MSQPPSELDRRIADWVVAHPGTVRVLKVLVGVILTIVSPTLRIAACIKPKDEGRRSVTIVLLNVGYLALSICTVAVLIVLLGNRAEPLRAGTWPGWWIWAWFLWSRGAEVLIAFYRDAMDRLKGKPAGSDLTGWRVWLAPNSYVELIVDYALLYALLPDCMWAAAPTKISEALWISASTITTSGSGGFSPTHWLPQLLSTSEIVGGVILLVVCFALYAGGATVVVQREKGAAAA